jgi:hypothetical protein
MSKIKLGYSSIHPTYLAKEEAENIFNEYADLTDARRYFSDEELQESKRTFIVDLMNGHKEHYINHITEQINDIKPCGVYGVYDFNLIRQYEAIAERIKAF